jgi:hypothetical protein
VAGGGKKPVIMRVVYGIIAGVVMLAITAGLYCARRWYGWDGDTGSPTGFNPRCEGVSKAHTSPTVCYTLYCYVILLP